MERFVEEFRKSEQMFDAALTRAYLSCARLLLERRSPGDRLDEAASLILQELVRRLPSTRDDPEVKRLQALVREPWNPPVLPVLIPRDRPEPVLPDKSPPVAPDPDAARGPTELERLAAQLENDRDKSLSPLRALQVDLLRTVAGGG